MATGESVGKGGCGIDILQLAAAAKQSIEATPPQSIIVGTTEPKPKKRHEKKTLLKRKDQQLCSKEQGCTKNDANKKGTNDIHDSSNIHTPKSLETAHHRAAPQAKAGQSMMILKRHDIVSKPTNKLKKREPVSTSKKVDGSHGTLHQELSKLRQELAETKKRLEQEKITRKACEVNNQKIQNELASTRQTLEHETQFRKNCQRDMEQLREHLDNERSLREKSQDIESNCNNLITHEKENARKLKLQLQLEQQSKQSIMGELEDIKAKLLSEKSLSQTLRDEVSTAKNLNSDLQQKLSNDSASSVSLKMELHSMKVRIGKVEEVEHALKQEIYKVEHLQNELAKVESVTAELEVVNEKLSRMDNLKMELLLERSKVQELEAKLEDHSWYRKRSDSIPVDGTRGARSQSISSSKYDDLDDIDINVEKLRKELHETREALKAERKKNATLTAKKSKTAEVSSLQDWINLALPSTAEVNMPPATQVSLTDGSAQKETPRDDASDHIESNKSHYFDGTKNEFCGDEGTTPLEDELVFIMSAYSSEEIIISENKDKVTYVIDLPANYNEEVQIKVVVHIPQGYPSKGMLAVNIAISESSNCSGDMRKCLIDTLPKLSQLCSWEAEANYGQEALFSVLNTADGWAQNEWPGILNKHFPSFKILQKPKQQNISTDIYSALIYTHHLIEPEKLQLVKKITSKLSLSGFIKSGKPGLILISSISESDCDSILNELKCQASQKVFRSTAFKLVGKHQRQTLDMDLSVSKMSFLDNSKEGMDELVRACDSLGMAEMLNDIT